MKVIDPRCAKPAGFTGGLCRLKEKAYELGECHEGSVFNAN